MIPFGLVLQTEFFQFGITAGDVNCCILFSGGSQSYSMEEFGGKKGRRNLYGCSLSRKRQGCLGRWVLRVWRRGKLKFIHFWGKIKRWKGRRTDPICVHGTRLPFCLFLCTPLRAHRSSWVLWDPSLFTAGLSAPNWLCLAGACWQLALLEITANTRHPQRSLSSKCWADLLLSRLLKRARIESQGSQLTYCFRKVSTLFSIATSNHICHWKVPRGFAES